MDKTKRNFNCFFNHQNQILLAQHNTQKNEGSILEIPIFFIKTNECIAKKAVKFYTKKDAMKFEWNELYEIEGEACKGAKYIIFYLMFATFYSMSYASNLNVTSDDKKNSRAHSGQSIC